MTRRMISNCDVCKCEFEYPKEIRQCYLENPFDIWILNKQIKLEDICLTCAASLLELIKNFIDTQGNKNDTTQPPIQGDLKL